MVNIHQWRGQAMREGAKWGLFLVKLISIMQGCGDYISVYMHA